MSPTSAPTRADAMSALRDILGENRLLTLATVSPEGEAHASIAFFAAERDFRIRIVSPPNAEHSSYIETNPSASVTVFDSRQDDGRRRGVQLFGTIKVLSAPNADAAFQHFAARFADAPLHADRRIYEFTPDRAKVFDETRLLQNEYVTINLSRSSS